MDKGSQLKEGKGLKQGSKPVEKNQAREIERKKRVKRKKAMRSRKVAPAEPFLEEAAELAEQVRQVLQETGADQQAAAFEREREPDLQNDCS
jgi:hypothetical protein